MGIRIGHHGGVTMAFEQGKLVHDQAFDTTPIRLCDLPCQPTFVDSLDGMPVQAKELRNMFNRQELE